MVQIIMFIVDILIDPPITSNLAFTLLSYSIEYEIDTKPYML